MAEYDLFLSYNRKSAAAVESICSGLRSCGIHAFLDIDSLPKGLPWMTELAKALDSTRAVAVFLGEEGPGETQESEVQLALTLQAEMKGRGRSYPVFAVLLPGARRADIPVWLRLNTWVDLTADIEDPEKLAELIAAIPGAKAETPPARQRSRRRLRSSLVRWGAVTIVVAAVLVWAAANRIAALRRGDRHPLAGPISIAWTEPASWSNADWRNSGKAWPTLLISGPNPGLIKTPYGVVLRDFKVIFNLAVRAGERSAAWLVRADRNEYYLFRYSFPRDGKPGELRGLLQLRGKQPAEFCRQSLYTEPFPEGHALIVVAQIAGQSVEHKFNLTCPLSDPRCQGEHDPLENEPQAVPCVLPANGPAAGGFGFVAGDSTGEMEVQEFELAGLPK